MLLRATRECITSPQIATFAPSSPPRCSRIVSISSSACVGCSFMPSPALTTLAFTCLASSVGAPLIGWRMMMTSVPIWSSVTPVSMSVSPLATLDALAEIFAAAADMYLLASSKDMRVRVEFS